ncbi:MAG: shikimate kinase [Acidobacteriota bacterium]|nr:shikimate kinase [Acidobacteriota bacterium]
MTANIYLIGFMGAGKSTIGPTLAKALDLVYLDLDSLVVHAAGMSIPEIFARQGEPAFRKMEEEELRKVEGPALISLGGGAFMTGGVREYIRQTGLSIYLDWPLEVLRNRVKNDPNRPLARDPEQFAALFHKRLPTYRQADLVWKSQPPHRADPQQVVDALVEAIRNTDTTT